MSSRSDTGRKGMQHAACRGSSTSPQVRGTGLAWPYPRILAHRSGGSLAPENTIAGLRCAAKLGFSAVEVDAMLSRDGVPVLMHDPEFGRTVLACGNVSDFDAAELTRLDAGSWHGECFANEGVPLLREALEYGAASGIWINVEIKPAPGKEIETGRRVAEEVTAFCDARRNLGIGEIVAPLLSSFSMDALAAAAAKSPDLPRALLLERATADWPARLERCAAVALHIHHAALTAPLAASVREAGYGLLCYTINDAARARELLTWGVDALCTDRLDRIGPDFADRIAETLA